MPYKEGESVYFIHPKHSWVVGRVMSAVKDTYACKAADEPRKVTGDTIEKLTEDQLTTCREDMTNDVVDDLLQLTILHDSTLLRCLHLRYMKDIVYTNIGAIVVALNPFNYKIPHYMDEMMPKYLAEGDKIEKNLPHSWAQAHNTYNEMINDTRDQCVLISGESGAGKTEATKIVMKYLANISCKRGSDSEKQAGMQVGVKLTACSPFLEAFGNAKTVRNDNSSRFGKFMKVKFATNGMLVGAHVTKYLLEKSRIVTASPGERIYHAFYLCVRGKLSASLGLGHESTYVSLNAGQTLQNSEFNTPEHFDEVCSSMLKVGMSENEIKTIWSCTAAILSMQNVQFAKKDEGAEVVGTTVTYLNDFINKLQIDSADLNRELTTTTLELRGETIVKLMSHMQAIDSRDALCKVLYDSVFTWLIEKCNEMCDVPSDGPWIGLLDIFGFEDFELNSFEQLCINLANETLQNHYNNIIFTRDQQECQMEGIDVTQVTCFDNTPCLQLITASKPPGLIALLDEECSLEKGTDLGFLEKVTQFHSGKNEFFERSKLAKTSFVVKHYAAQVSYEVHGWLDKNRDTLKDAMKVILRASKEPMVASLFSELEDLLDMSHFNLKASLRAKKKKTVGGLFKEQVGLLMDVINSTNPHWIRCIKPHPAKKPLHFDGITTMKQLESSGVLATVKIRKSGYPVRIPFNNFLKRYQVISPSEGAPEQRCVAILTATGINDKKVAQIGKTKVYMKSEAYPILERKRSDVIESWSRKLERYGRGYLVRMEAFKLWWQKHKEKLLAEKKAREEKERLEREAREAEERAKREAERVARAAFEEQERVVREAHKAEESTKREAERNAREEGVVRLVAQRKAREEKERKAAVCIQTNFRGCHTRRCVYREIVEKQRAMAEGQVEVQTISWRQKHVSEDNYRHLVEKSWCKFLRDAEYLLQLKQVEQNRKKKIDAAKERIKVRQQAHVDAKNKKAEVYQEKVVLELQRLELEQHEKAAEAARQNHTAAAMKETKEKMDARNADLLQKELQSIQKAHQARINAQMRDDLYIMRHQQAWDQAKGHSPPPHVSTPSPLRNVTAEVLKGGAHLPDMKSYWQLHEDWEEAQEHHPRDASPKMRGSGLRASTPPSGTRRAYEAAMEANHRRNVDMAYLFSPDTANKSN